MICVPKLCSDFKFDKYADHCQPAILNYFIGINNSLYNSALLKWKNLIMLPSRYVFLFLINITSIQPDSLILNKNDNKAALKWTLSTILKKPKANKEMILITKLIEQIKRLFYFNFHKCKWSYLKIRKKKLPTNV